MVPWYNLTLRKRLSWAIYNDRGENLAGSELPGKQNHKAHITTALMLYMNVVRITREIT